MRKRLTVAGVMITLLGAVWILQGVNVLGGSPMTGDPFWAQAGVVCVLVGLILVYIGERSSVRM